jgi:hypothetical protein
MPNIGISVLRREVPGYTGARTGLVAGGYRLAFGAISLAFGVLAGVLVGFFVRLPFCDVKVAANHHDQDEVKGLEYDAEEGWAGQRPWRP